MTGSGLTTHLKLPSRSPEATRVPSGETRKQRIPPLRSCEVCTSEGVLAEFAPLEVLMFRSGLSHWEGFQALQRRRVSADQPYLQNKART